MAFGQQSGPPASSGQVKRLLALVQDAGHADFRDARGPLGLTQRQAGGKFTRAEAEALIDQLEAAEHEGATAEPTAERVPAPRVTRTDEALRKMPAERLAAELQRRGWIVVEP